MNISYRPFEFKDSSILQKMTLDFYDEDRFMNEMSAEKIKNTIDYLTTHPDRGDIIMIEKESEIVGYALLINIWSNEYGGNVLYIDEIYIIPSARNQKIGTNFIQHIMDTKFNNRVSLLLLVSPTNKRAKNLYEKLGFKPHKYDQLIFESKPNNY